MTEFINEGTYPLHGCVLKPPHKKAKKISQQATTSRRAGKEQDDSTTAAQSVEDRAYEGMGVD